MTTSINLLLVEDNAGDARLLREALREEESANPETAFELHHVVRLSDALQMLRPCEMASGGERDGAAPLTAPQMDVVLLDLSLPDGQGLGNVRQLHEAAPDVPIVVLTGQVDEKLALEVVSAGAQDYLVKGEVEGRVLVRSLRYAIERAQTQEALRDSEERFRLLAENVRDLICLHDCEGCYLYVSPSCQRLLGYEPAEMLGHNPYNWFHPDDIPQIRHTHEASLRGEMISSVIYRLRHKSGHYVWLETLTQPIFENGVVTQLQTATRDITERKSYESRIQEQVQQLSEAREALEEQHDQLLEANARLEDLATSDGLTSLKNHRAFQERLAEEFARARRHHTPLSLLMMDVDKFKAFNDTFGHPAGDEVLKSVARLLRDTTRDIDFAARYGGEEFVVVLPNTDAPGARILAERSRMVIEQAPWPQRPITISIGAATLSPQVGRPQETAQDLVEAADRALYQSKQAGRNRVTLADD